MNNLAPMKNCPGGVQGNLNWMPGYRLSNTNYIGYFDSVGFIIILNNVHLMPICTCIISAKKEIDPTQTPLTFS